MSTRPGPVVLMGVSGSGKSTLAEMLAARLPAPFLEGDDLHPPANVARMAAGIPLTDADRAPWLDRIGAWLAAQPGWAVATCSALRRAYRDRLRDAAPGLRFILPDVSADTLERRLTHRTGHFMPASLLPSQLALLERPGPDEAALVLDGTAPVEFNIARCLAWLGATPA